MALSGRLLPVHLKPQPDEQLSSWLIRLAHAHGATLYTFCHLLWPQRALWNGDVDRVFDESTLTVLAKCTATPYQRVLETTLKAFEDKLVERFSPSAYPIWLLRPGLLYRAQQSYGLQFCGRCLATDTVPYFRRRWRLAFATVCLDHHCRLVDACPFCDAPVNTRRSPVTLPFSWRCHVCHGHLMKTTAQPVATDSAIVGFQRYLVEGLENGSITVGNETLDALTFFEALHLLFNICAMEAIVNSPGVELRKSALYNVVQNPEQLRVNIRYDTIQFLYEMFTDQSERFIALCQSIRLGNESLPRNLFQPSGCCWYLVLWHFYSGRSQLQQLLFDCIHFCVFASTSISNNLHVRKSASLCGIPHNEAYVVFLLMWYSVNIFHKNKILSLFSIT